MNKENNWSAAGLRRSAIAERIRLREEWSALKGLNTSNTVPSDTQTGIAAKKKLINKQNKTVENLPVSEVLCGVVALVDVGDEQRGIALRATLTALGATVVNTWSPLVTHLVWAQGGCRATRAKARALAATLVSPLWVEACAASQKRQSERTFPAATRPSDLPSPRTLRRRLKRAEMENLPLDWIDRDDENEKMLRLRLSSDTTNTSADSVSHESTVLGSKVKTVPRVVAKKVLSQTPVVRQRVKSRRNLFTHKEPDLARRSDDDSDESDCTPAKKSQRDRRALVKAHRITRKLLKRSYAYTQPTQTQANSALFRIVLTGMHRQEKHAVARAVRSLQGRLQKDVNKFTTHVLLGSCREDAATDSSLSAVPPTDELRPRTLKALCGAARGCRVLTTQWALDSAILGTWLHPHNYAVPHLKKISQKARVERVALRYQKSEYGYNIFQGLRVHVLDNAEQKVAASELLKLCGACTQNGGLNQDGRADDSDIKIGVHASTVKSKWIFDCVAAGRIKSRKHYINS